MVVELTPVEVAAEVEAPNLPDLALILPAPASASVPKYGGIVGRDPYDCVDCTHCCEPVYARNQVIAGKVRDVIPVDEDGLCPSCAWDEPWTDSVDTSPEAIADRILAEVDGLDATITRLRSTIPDWYREENHDYEEEVA